MSECRAYLTVFAWVALISLLAVAALNYFVDPYYRFGTNRIGVYISAEREFKATAVQKLPHNALILGNSKPAGIDPLELKGWQFLNAGFGGATPEEMYAFLKHFAHEQELVVLGVDFGMFNEKEKAIVRDPFERSMLRDMTAYLLSLKSLQYSFESLLGYAVGQGVTILPTGQSNPAAYLEKDAAFTREYYGPTLRLLKERAFHDFKYSSTRVNDLEKIRDLMKERGIRLQVFINPENAAVLALLGRVPASALVDQWKADMRRIFPDLIDLSADPQWQAHSLYYWHDPYHYRPDTGARFMREAVLPGLNDDAPANQR